MQWITHKRSQNGCIACLRLARLNNISGAGLFYIDELYRPFASLVMQQNFKIKEAMI